MCYAANNSRAKIIALCSTAVPLPQMQALEMSLLKMFSSGVIFSQI